MGRDIIEVGRMTVRERALMRVVPIGVSLAMAAGLAFAPATALADEGHAYEAATIRVTQQSVDTNNGATWDAYKIFDADIDSEDNASHIAWASDNAKTATLAFLDSLSGSEEYAAWLTSRGATQSGAHDNAQNAAEFVAHMIANDEDDPVFASSPASKLGGSFADRFARAIQGATPAVSHLTSGSGGVISGGTEGYYLIVTTPSTIGVNESGSAAMWVPMGGSLGQIQSKETAPRTSFNVMEDHNISSGQAADANVGQDFQHVLTGWYPSNLRSYSEYFDQYVVTLPDTMSTRSGVDGVNAADFTLSLNAIYPAEGYPNGKGLIIEINSDNADQYEGVSIVANGQQAIITINDLQAVYDSVAQEHPGVKFTSMGITFFAHLDADAVMGSAGQEATMVRTYTKDPVSLESTTSNTMSIKYFTYQAQITKIDKASQQPLQGAGFYITTSTDCTYSWRDSEYYVQADGSLSTTPYEFFTGSDGTFQVPGIDEGVYTIHENTVPAGYSEPDSDTVLTVSSGLNQTRQTVDFSASVTGGEAAVIEGDAATTLAGQDATLGKAFVQIVNEKSFEMPYTGLKGDAGLYAIAAMLGVCGTGVAYAGTRRSRKAAIRG